MIWAFEVETDRADFSRWCFAEGLARELLLRPIGRTVYFMPPYVLGDDEFALLVGRTQRDRRCGLSRGIVAVLARHGSRWQECWLWSRWPAPPARSCRDPSSGHSALPACRSQRSGVVVQETGKPRPLFALTRTARSTPHR